MVKAAVLNANKKEKFPLRFRLYVKSGITKLVIEFDNSQPDLLREVLDFVSSLQQNECESERNRNLAIKRDEQLVYQFDSSKQCIGKYEDVWSYQQASDGF